MRQIAEFCQSTGEYSRELASCCQWEPIQVCIHSRLASEAIPPIPNELTNEAVYWVSGRATYAYVECIVLEHCDPTGRPLGLADSVKNGPIRVGCENWYPIY